MKSILLRALPVMLAGVVLAMGGYVHGVWTNRWAVSEDLERAVARLDLVPTTLGDWRGEADKPLSDRDVETAGFSGYLVRRYTHGPSGVTVNVLLACGRPGPLAVHTPDVCYRGSGFQLSAPPSRQTEPVPGTDATAELWMARLGKPGSADPTRLTIYWSWSPDGAWRAPDNPRLSFAGSPALYKLYVIQEVQPNDNAERLGRDFLGRLLPELDRALFEKP